MSKPVDDLKGWFANLSTEDKKAVVTFLYEGKVLLREGMYFGPRPSFVTRGLHVGPAPSASVSTCPSCGRPY